MTRNFAKRPESKSSRSQEPNKRLTAFVPSHILGTLAKISHNHALAVSSIVWLLRNKNGCEVLLNFLDSSPVQSLTTNAILKSPSRQMAKWSIYFPLLGVGRCVRCDPPSSEPTWKPRLQS